MLDNNLWINRSRSAGTHTNLYQSS
jgi:hypothetical protein